jgi:KipI family sensor histidine kinase inhibitor
MQARRVGERALLVECRTTTEVEAAYAVLRRAEALRATDIVPAARTVLVDGLADVDAALVLLSRLSVEPLTAASAATLRVEIPVRYDGPDLVEVAGQWEVEPAEVVRIHTSTEFVVAFCGFAPGFAYCAGLPVDRMVRRRQEPRTRVPAGSVAVAGEFTSVYPSASPGGWQLLGRTDTRVWRPEAEHPALLAPGTRVRFVDVAQDEPLEGRRNG